ncbi:hypothetical protein ACLB2K_049124 [Fragaria x ananassa]
MRPSSQEFITNSSTWPIKKKKEFQHVITNTRIRKAFTFIKTQQQQQQQPPSLHTPQSQPLHRSQSNYVAPLLLFKSHPTSPSVPLSSSPPLINTNKNEPSDSYSCCSQLHHSLNLLLLQQCLTKLIPPLGSTRNPATAPKPKPTTPSAPRSHSRHSPSPSLSPTTPSPSSTDPTTPVLIDASSARHLSYSEFLSHFHFLTSSLSSLLSKSQVAYILSHPSLHIPVLYFSLLALGAVVSPANPVGSDSEIAYQVKLTRPAIVFATSATARKLPEGVRTILLDSPEFLSMLESPRNLTRPDLVEVLQTDPALILYSSGTTGRVKGVVLTHRNFIALIAGMHAVKIEPDPDEPVVQPVSMFTLPLFHVFGFFMLVRAVSMGETLVLMEKFYFEGMLKAVERFKVTFMPVSPPLIMALAKSELAEKYDLSSLRLLRWGKKRLRDS